MIQLKQMGLMSGTVPITSFTMSSTEMRLYSANHYFIIVTPVYIFSTN